MGRKLLAAASFAVGLLIFIIVLSVVGFENVTEPFRDFSLFYLFLFLMVSSLLHVVTALRWSTVLRHQGLKVPFFPLLGLKLVGTAIGYLTPASRIGGEPVRGYLLRKKFGIDGKLAYSSAMIETVLGLSIDAVFTSVIIITMLVFFTLPAQVAGFALAISLLAIILMVAFYSVLICRLGPFSFMFRISALLIKSRFLKSLIGKIVMVEETMVEFFHSKRKGVAAAILISSINWPLTYFQYKFALLSIGFDAPFTIIVLSIMAITLAGVVPIPAAFGVQEAGQFSLFSIISMSSIGIALSLLIRFKDLITAFFGLVLLSHEGLSLVDVLRNKNDKA